MSTGSSVTCKQKLQDFELGMSDGMESQFYAIFGDLLKHCTDYSTLKTVQKSSSVMNALFTCPSQTVWRQLCKQQNYQNLLDRASKRNNRVWECLYYQNWKVDRNWLGAVFILALLELGLDALHKRPFRNHLNAVMADLRPSQNILSFVNGGVSFAVSFAADLSDGFVSLWDLRRGMRLDRCRSFGAISSFLLHKNTLYLGKHDGLIQLCSFLKEPQTIRIHPAEVTVIIAGWNESIISANAQGSIVQCSLDGSQPKELYRHPDSSINTLLLLNEETLFAGTDNGCLIKLVPDSTIKIYYFYEFGALNCLTRNGEAGLLIGTDSGRVLGFDVESEQLIEIMINDQEPITAISADKKRLAVGCFDGTVVVLEIEGFREILRLKNHFGPIWSIGIDACYLLTSSLDGIALSRNFFAN